MSVFQSLFISFVFTAVTYSNAFAQGKEKPIEIIPLADNLYQHISYKHVEGYGLVPANGLIVVNQQEAFIIDTPWTSEDTADLHTWLTKKQLNLTGSISTHSHEDRSGGIGYLNNNGIDTYATEKTNSLLKLKPAPMATKTLAPVNDVLFHQQIETYYPGAGHSSDNIVVWLPQYQMLAGGCLVKSIASTGLGYTGDADIQAWPLTIDNVNKAYPSVKKVIPGHGKIGNKALLQHTKALVLASQAATN